MNKSRFSIVFVCGANRAHAPRDAVAVDVYGSDSPVVYITLYGFTCSYFVLFKGWWVSFPEVLRWYLAKGNGVAVIYDIHDEFEELRTCVLQEEQPLSPFVGIAGDVGGEICLVKFEM